MQQQRDARTRAAGREISGADSAAAPALISILLLFTGHCQRGHLTPGVIPGAISLGRPTLQKKDISRESYPSAHSFLTTVNGTVIHMVDKLTMHIPYYVHIAKL